MLRTGSGALQTLPMPGTTGTHRASTMVTSYCCFGFFFVFLSNERGLFSFGRRHCRRRIPKKETKPNPVVVRARDGGGDGTETRNGSPSLAKINEHRRSFSIDRKGRSPPPKKTREHEPIDKYYYGQKNYLLPHCLWEFGILQPASNTTLLVLSVLPACFKTTMGATIMYCFCSCVVRIIAEDALPCF